MEKQTKICATCKKNFEKKITCSRADWLITKFCSRPCQIQGRIYIKPRYKIPLGSIPWNKGLYKTLNTGKTYFKKGITPWNKGIKMTSEQKKNMNVARPKAQGKNNPRWRGGITPENLKIRHSLEYKAWRKSVFERDNYTCTICGIKGGWHKDTKNKIYLIADHIRPFALFPKLRFELSNGRTLCKPCDNKYGYKYNRHLSFKENLKNFKL